MEEGGKGGRRCGGVVSPTVSKEIPARSVRGGQAAVTSRHARLGLKFRRFRKFVAFILKTRGRRPVRSIGSASGASQLPFGAHTVPVAPPLLPGGETLNQSRVGAALFSIPEAFFPASLLSPPPGEPGGQSRTSKVPCGGHTCQWKELRVREPSSVPLPRRLSGAGGERHAELRRDFDAVLRLSCSLAAVRRSEPRQK